MKKRGFTLVELLAVIVILAIIALIAVPTVLNILDKANKSAFKDTAYGVIQAGELYFAEQLLDLDGMRSDVVFDLSEGKLQLKGKVPEGQVAVNTTGQVALAVTNGRYCITKTYSAEDVTVVENASECELPVKVLAIGDPVYYNPGTGEVCEYDGTTSATGVKEGCMRWYIYKQEGNNMSLILDHNTTALTAWINEEDYGCGEIGSWCARNDKGPITLMNRLKADTETWKVEADIIEAEDVFNLIPYYVELEDKENFNSYGTDWDAYWNLYNAALNDSMMNVPQSDYSSVDEYLDAVLDYAEENYSRIMLPRGFFRDLLYEYVITGENPSTYGYWTKSPVAGYTYSAWDVYYSGLVDYDFVSNADLRGVRPVISLSKSILQ